MPFTSIRAKLGTMRVPQDFTVLSQGENIIIQSSKSIGIFDPKTGHGLLNTTGTYAPYLSPALGAVPYTFSRDVVAAALAVCPPHGKAMLLVGPRA
jgi:hypothetical protein